MKKGSANLDELLVLIKKNKQLEELVKELALALEIAAVVNSHGDHWNVYAPFQNKINELLIKAGREKNEVLAKFTKNGAARRQ